MATHDGKQLNNDGTLVKRLTPTNETQRRLHLMSGNLCAFPLCTSPIMGTDGILKGEICHIEAAGAEGQRFNRAMTNESRRAYENLILLCFEHHIITDYKEQYTIARMQSMKATHEARFDKFEEALRIRLGDSYYSDEAVREKSLRYMNEVTESGEADAQDIEAVSSFASRMQTIDEFPRTVLCAIIDSTVDVATVSAAVLESRFRTNGATMQPALDVLETSDLISVDAENSRTPADVQIKALHKYSDEYPLPKVVEVCRKTKLDVSFYRSNKAARSRLVLTDESRKMECGEKLQCLGSTKR